VRIGFLGTRGVPAQYGGFETAAEEIGVRLVDRGHDVVVYCRNPRQTLKTYRGMRLVNLPALRRKSLETLSHTFLSSLHAATTDLDCAILFNAANAPVLPALRMPVAVHLDGLEWKRAKWEGFGRRYLKWSERLAVTRARTTIADARGIQDYVRDTYGRDSVFIPYGAPIINADDLPAPANLAVTPRGFHLVVARLEPENSVELILRAFLQSDARFPLVLVGDNPYPSAYRDECRRLAASSSRIVHLGSLWEQDVLDWYYANCLVYLHGHTVGGTNPSLLRAMGAAAFVVARDVSFNREVAGEEARFFSTAQGLAAELERAERQPEGLDKMREMLRARAATSYRWDDVAEAYESMCRAMVEARQ
jgi:glycosyltransferase involved in cell wall biosynthesis